MAIRAPGYHPVRGGRINKMSKAKRSVVAVLSLTAMVDMFTVLTVFLLQNYNQTGIIIETPKEIVLPQARMSEDLIPAHLVTITKDKIMVGRDEVATVADIVNGDNWMIKSLFDRVQADIEKAKQENLDRKKFEEGLQQSAAKSTSSEPEIEQAKAQLKQKFEERFRKVTVQADQETEFSLLKRVMFTVTEAGAGEINFAVLKKAEDG